MNELEEVIIDQIKSHGPLSFHDFMELALYHDQFGYYSCGKPRTGINGDFMTSPSITGLFGEMLAVQIEEVSRMLDENPMIVVEFGGGNGSLCNDILNAVAPGLINYYIIEKSHVPVSKEINCTFLNDLNGIGEFSGIVLSNELVDNFPVHRVVMRKELMEVFVDYDVQKGFYEILLPASGELTEFIEQLSITLPKNFCMEINLQTKKWLSAISQKMVKGFIITIDYGYTLKELTASSGNGTVTAYANHRRRENIYNEIGNLDITSHVNFSAMSHFGRQLGFECCGYASQLSFLQGLGLVEYIRKIEKAGNQAYTQLLHSFLYDMGNKFKVLIQQKGLDKPFLSGMRLGEMI